MMSTQENHNHVLIAAVQQGLLGNGSKDTSMSLDDKPLGVFYDGDAWEANLKNAREAFPKSCRFLHACAVKTNPLEWFLNRAKELGMGPSVRVFQR